MNQFLKLDLEKFKQENLHNKNKISDLEKEISILQRHTEHINTNLAQCCADKQHLENNILTTKQDLQNDVIRMRNNNEEILRTKDQTINLLSDRLDVQKKENENKYEKNKDLSDHVSSLMVELEKSKQIYEMLKNDLTSQLNSFKIKNDDLMMSLTSYKFETEEKNNRNEVIKRELEDIINKLKIEYETKIREIDNMNSI